MEKIMIINGSPRAPRSNSRQYAGLFSRFCQGKTDYFAISRSNHLKLCRAMEEYSDVLLVFPLYADSIPVTLLNFLKTLENHMPSQRPVISVIINCGFMEPRQNDIAIEMLRFYCKRCGFPFGSVLKIGSGEAILSTPFRILLNAKMKKTATSILSGKYGVFQTTMPIPKRLFLRASTVYWENYGKRNGITKKEMSTMEIEKNRGTSQRPL